MIVFELNPNGESNNQVAPENADLERNRCGHMGASLLAAVQMGDRFM